MRAKTKSKKTKKKSKLKVANQRPENPRCGDCLQIIGDTFIASGRVDPKAPVTEDNCPYCKEHRKGDRRLKLKRLLNRIQKETTEAPNGPVPMRDSGKRPRLIASSKPCPIKLEGTKWKQIRRWCRKTIRAVEKETGSFVTVVALLSFVTQMKKWPYAKRLKAQDRIKALYAPDYETDSAVAKGLIQRVYENERRRAEEAAAGGPKTAGKDCFGNRLGTAAAQMNAVLGQMPLSKDEIKEAAGVFRSSHIQWLIDNGWALKTKYGNYRLTRAGRAKRGI